jgi:hypothetical protein
MEAAGSARGGALAAHICARLALILNLTKKYRTGRR